MRKGVADLFLISRWMGKRVVDLFLISRDIGKPLTMAVLEVLGQWASGG